MGNLIELFPHHPSKEELITHLDKMYRLLEVLNKQEPEDMNSEEYEQWGQDHEDLEDQIDDILDLLDETE